MLTRRKVSLPWEINLREVISTTAMFILFLSTWKFTKQRNNKTVTSKRFENSNGGISELDGGTFLRNNEIEFDLGYMYECNDKIRGTHFDLSSLPSKSSREGSRLSMLSVIFMAAESRYTLHNKNSTDLVYQCWIFFVSLHFMLLLNELKITVLASSDEQLLSLLVRLTIKKIRWILLFIAM